MVNLICTRNHVDLTLQDHNARSQCPYKYLSTETVTSINIFKVKVDILYKRQKFLIALLAAIHSKANLLIY